jgi:CRP/FNR family transcriptional regulator, anaerobic regulatory protein
VIKSQLLGRKRQNQRKPSFLFLTMPIQAKFMTTQIIRSIQALVPLNEAEEKAFLSILDVKTYKKKEFLLQEGQVCNKITFINSGCMRLFYNVDGIENTIQFFFDDSWYTDYASFLTGQPTIENMQALETCEVVQFNKEDLNKLFNLFPIFDRVGRVMAENAYLSLSKLNQMLRNEEPELRYLNLLKQRPELVLHISQHYIASYLGVKPESLSRIKKRISPSK